MPHIITKNSQRLSVSYNSLILKLAKHRFPITFTIMLYGLIQSICNVLAGSAI